MSIVMKKLIIGGTEYEIVDDTARTNISGHETRISEMEAAIGDLESLETEKKGSIVEAVNEIANGALNDLIVTDSTNKKWRIVVSTEGVLSTERVIDPINRVSVLSNVAEYYDDGIYDGEEYVTTFVATDGYTLEDASVSVTMGGVDITSEVYDFGSVVIPSVTGDVEIHISATQINYVTPPASDWEMQLYQGKQALKTYTGADTAIEIPLELEVDGTVYSTSLYNLTFPSTVEHIKAVPLPPPAWGAVTARITLPGSLKTLWTDGTVFFKTSANAEKIFIPNMADSTVQNYTFQNNTKLRTARQFIPESARTSMGSFYYGCTNLIDAGTIPEGITGIGHMLQGASKLRRVRIESKVITDHASAFSNIPSDCQVYMYPDSATFEYFRDSAPAQNAVPQFIFRGLGDTQINEVYCIGDSLTAGMGTTDSSAFGYVRRLSEKVSSNTACWNGGLGSSTSQWALDRINSAPWNHHIKSAVWVIWTGTNGNGSGDATVATLKSNITAISESLGSNEKVLFVTAIPTALSPTREMYDDLVQWYIDTFGADKVFDVYAYFDSLNLTRTDFMADHLHYNNAGYSIVAKGIYDKLTSNGWVEASSIPSATISVDHSSASLGVGETLQLTATVAPTNATSTVVYDSSNRSVATVSDDGLITAVASGTTNIYIVVDEKAALCVITVE